MQQGLGNLNHNNYFGLEDKLERVLRPVTPDPAFISTLKTRLSNTPSVILEASRRRLGFMLIGFGLLSGAIAFWILRKFKG